MYILEKEPVCPNTNDRLMFWSTSRR